MKSRDVAIQVKATEQDFPVVLFIISSNAVQYFFSMHEFSFIFYFQLGQYR